MIFLAGALQVLTLLLLGPLFSTFIRKVHARIQGRQGPPLLQGHYDILKLLRKDRVYSVRSSFVTRLTPAVNFAVVCVAALMIPVLSTEVPFHFAGDFIFFIYLFGLARFLTALTGLDAGSTFGGMASSREMTLSSLAEPAILLGFIVVSTAAGSMDISVMTAQLINLPGKYLNPFFILTLLSFSIVIMAENGRVPFDNPATHLELTMIHEGMVLELSGRDLGVFQLAHGMRLLALTVVALDVFFPFGLAMEFTVYALAVSFGALLLKLFIAGVAVAYVETANAKYRLFRLPDLLTLAFALSLIALIAYYATEVAGVR